MKLSGKNFQPWADFSLTLEGLTVLVGPSNQGKSSLFRAIKGVLRNDIPEDFVRNGQEKPLEVELEVDGHYIKATRKRKGSIKYIVDGKEYTSLGGKVPDEVEKLMFGEVKIGEFLLDPIFATQNKSQFLIDSDRWKPNELNAIFGAFSSTEKLDAGKKEANLRLTQRKSEAGTLATEIRSAEERSAKMLDIMEATTLIADAIHALEGGVRKSEAIVGQLGSILHHQSRLRPLQVILNALTLPDLKDASILTRQVENLGAAGEALAISKFLRKLETNLTLLAESWSGVFYTYKQGKGLEEVLVLLDKLSIASLSMLAESLTSIINVVEAYLVDARTLNDRISCIAMAREAIQANEGHTLSLAEESIQLEQAEAELESLRREFATEEANFNAAEKAKITTCPRCGRGLEHICQ